MEGMRTATDPLALAQARDLRRAWAETAAVRDRNFMQKQEVTMQVNHHVLIEHALADSAMTLFKSMRGVASQQEQQVIDVTDNEQEKPI
jgi:hypothetical protein